MSALNPSTSAALSPARLGLMVAGAAIVSAVGVGAMSFSATNAAFSGVTDNTGNSFSAAAITLTDNDSDVALFSATDLVPGETVEACIEVTYDGVADDIDDLRLYGSSSGDLADDLNLSVVRGAAGSTCAALGATSPVYDGGLDALGADYDSGSSGLAPTSTSETVAYQFAVTLDAATDDASQGATAGADFVWEVRSN